MLRVEKADGQQSKFEALAVEVMRIANFPGEVLVKPYPKRGVKASISLWDFGAVVAYGKTPEEALARLVVLLRAIQGRPGPDGSAGGAQVTRLPGP